MAKSPTDILREEHEVVLKLLDELEKNISSKDIKSAEKNMLTLEKEFKKHSLNKEEKALFPELEKFMPRDGGPTGVMVAEHKELVGYIKDSRNAIKAKELKKLDSSGSSIINILRPHIEKENGMLFMMADMHLDEKQKEAILKKFRKFD